MIYEVNNLSSKNCLINFDFVRARCIMNESIFSKERGKFLGEILGFSQLLERERMISRGNSGFFPL